MRNLFNYFVNPFRSSRISLDDLIAFATELIQRLIALNPGIQIAARVDSLTTALDTLLEQADADHIQLGVRKGGNLVKDRFRAALPEAIRPIYGQVLAAFSAPSQEMKEIFPEGRRVFSKSRNDALGGHLHGLVEELTRHQAVLGTAVVARATELRDQWQAIHHAAETATGAKTVTEDDQRNARFALERELFLAMTDLIALHPDEPGRFNLYLPQHLLRSSKPTRRQETADTYE